MQYLATAATAQVAQACQQQALFRFPCEDNTRITGETSCRAAASSWSSCKLNRLQPAGLKLTAQSAAAKACMCTLQNTQECLSDQETGKLLSLVTAAYTTGTGAFLTHCHCSRQRCQRHAHRCSPPHSAHAPPLAPAPASHKKSLPTKKAPRLPCRRQLPLLLSSPGGWRATWCQQPQAPAPHRTAGRFRFHLSVPPC